MRSAGTCGKAPRRWRKTTIPDPAAAARADRIRRDFTADAGQLNARWCGDITSLGTWERWRYLATAVDVASRRVVGYALADHLRTELVPAALANALAARGPDPGVVFHSDRAASTPPAGSPPSRPAAASRRPWAAPANAGTTPLSESFSASLNGELIDLQAWATRAMARRAVVEHIAWYNGTRLHSRSAPRHPPNSKNRTR